MASYIKTLKEDNGDIIYPQTKGSAVLLDGGSDLESVLAAKADASTVSQKITMGDVQSADIVANAITTAKIANGAVTSGKIDWTTIPQGATGLTQQNFKGYFDIGNIRVQYMNLKQTGLNTAAYGYNVWQATWPAPFGNDWYCAVANATSDTGNVAGNDLKVTGRTTTTVQINYNHVTNIGSSEVYYSVIGIGLKPS